MINLQRDKNPMPEQDPNVRNKNFLEVTLGYRAAGCKRGNEMR